MNLDRLLDEVAVEWKALGAVCKVFNGYAFQSNQFNSVGEGLPLIRIRDVNTGFSETYYSGEYQERYLVLDGDILIGMDGDFRAVKWMHGKALLNQRVCRLQDFNSEILPGFMYYLVQGELDRIHSKIQASTVKHLSSKELEQAIIPVPALEVQAEIVRLLDDFTRLTAELIAKLSVELTARKKQYNYYRDRLLSFKGKHVECKELGEIGCFIRGNGMQKKDFVDVGFPAIHYGQIYTRYGLSAESTFSFVTETLATRLRNAQKNDLLLATTSENDEDVVKPLAWLGEQAAISGDMMIFRHAQNVKYLAYFFETDAFQEQKKKYITGAKVRRVASGDLAKIVAPIPCPDDPKKSLDIQAEVVRILDGFADLTAELAAELAAEVNARSKQYKYYRNQLLSFKNRESGMEGAERTRVEH